MQASLKIYDITTQPRAYETQVNEICMEPSICSLRKKGTIYWVFPFSETIELINLCG